LGHVPTAFVAVASALVLGPPALALVREHGREAGTIAVGLVAALLVYQVVRPFSSTPSEGSALERGRRVYISEGCINCHSQYVRPNTADVLIWGPTQTIDELREQHPPLIGNRRQGPDLSQIGGRRSALWLKAHFYDPRQVSHASFMPSYSYLFQNSTGGDDLVAYLSSLKSAEYPTHIELERAWQPSDASMAAATPGRGAQLFGAYCVTCHDRNGATRLAWMKSFTRIPPDLRTGPWLRLAATDTPKERVLHLAQIVKFGVPGTNMPGHEYLSDQDAGSIALWLSQNMAQPNPIASDHPLQGENR
jgi:cbb3-type cytochrome oxidase cytochrome c subunit